MPDIAKYAPAIAKATTEELHANLRAADQILIPTAAAQFKAALQAELDRRAELETALAIAGTQMASDEHCGHDGATLRDYGAGGFAMACDRCDEIAMTGEAQDACDVTDFGRDFEFEVGGGARIVRG